MKKIAIIYGSTTGNTETVAKSIAEKLSSEDVQLIEASNLKVEDVETFPNLILGTSTWGLGDLQDDWETALPILKKCDLSGKTIAFFGLGDSGSYSDTFVDAMGTLYEAIKNTGCTFVGKTSVKDYQFDASKAVVDDCFVGVALDEDSESNLTNNRLEQWIANILPHLQ
ncbi:MAG: flavodoxin [Bacteroidales bacterium]|jgi:flavodoxin I|nr:flavodoxin [Bacteroidales bacterium]